MPTPLIAIVSLVGVSALFLAPAALAEPVAPAPEMGSSVAAGQQGGVPSENASEVEDSVEPTGHTRFGFDDRPFGVNATLGFGTPVGLAGVILEYSPLPWLAVGTGAGTNLDGLQLAALGRIRPLYWEKPNHVFAIALEAAVATGPYSSWDDLSASFGDGDSKTQYARLDHALWLQPEAQFEYEARSGFHLVVSGAAAAFLLNSHAAECRNRVTDARVACDAAAGGTMATTIQAFTIELGYTLP
jgi:hypothetical protein